jgi:hypothetical protein
MKHKIWEASYRNKKIEQTINIEVMDLLQGASMFLSISLGIGALNEAFGYFKRDLRDNYSDYGALRTVLLYTTIPQARSVISRVRQHVILSSGKQQRKQPNAEEYPWTIRLAPDQAVVIKKSYDKSLNIIAVAVRGHGMRAHRLASYWLHEQGAIVAQIAITGLSLRDIDQINWTVEAAFVISLIAGLLSVYYACLVEVKLGGMHSPDEVCNWLTTPTISFEADALCYITPAYNAVLILVAPMQLLNWSLFSLLIGIGIYYGLMSERSESAVRGGNSGLAVLLVYVVFTTGATAAYVLPSVLNVLETTRHWQNAILEMDRLVRTAQRPDANEMGHILQPRTDADNILGLINSPVFRQDGERKRGRDTGSAIVHALQALIKAQKASLNAQEALLREYKAPWPIFDADQGVVQRERRTKRAMSDPN